MKSVTKRIKVFSPVKSRKITVSGHETCDADQSIFGVVQSKRCSPAKGRLAFDVSEMTPSDIPTSNENTTGSPSEDDAFDFDLPNIDYNGSSPESLSGSPDTVANCSIIGDHELLSVMSSTVAEIRCEQDMNAPGPNSVTSVKSVTKCIKVFMKSVKSTGSGYETFDAADQVV
ncbi:hypothetical protein Tco_0340670 [Tanacetum coccineum]